MSGIFTVPFTVGTILYSGYARGIFGAMSILAFLYTAYRIWGDERKQLVALEQHLAPRLRIEFDPNQAKFVSITPAGGFDILYVRVLARAMSPTVQNCRGYLQRVSQLQGETYVMLFDEPLLLPWSYQNPQAVQPRQLNHDVDAFLDVSWFVDPASGLLAFGLLNTQSFVPNRLQTILRDQVLPFPERNIKLDLVITGDDSAKAAFSLNIHRGQPRWDQPQIGWMKGDEIRRDSNI